MPYCFRHSKIPQSARVGRRSIPPRLLFAAALTVLLSTSGCLQPKIFSSTFTFNRELSDRMWERSISVLHQCHFQIARESKLEGVIETAYRSGSGILEPWHSDSQGAPQLIESTLQSIRRRVTVSMKPAEDGQLRLVVRVDKEQEDVPGEVARFEGGATFSDSVPLSRDLSGVVGQSGRSRWIPLGRDEVLEGILAQKIAAAQR